MPYTFSNSTCGTVTIGLQKGEAPAIKKDFSPEQEIIKMAGRERPVARYGTGGTRSINVSGVAFDVAENIQYASNDDIDKLIKNRVPWTFSDGTDSCTVVITSVSTSANAGQNYESVEVAMQEVDS